MAQQNEFSQDQEKIEVLALQDLEHVSGGKLAKAGNLQSQTSVGCFNSQTSINCNGANAALKSI